MLKPLLQLEKVEKKKVNNPFNFKSAAMVTTFIRSAGGPYQGRMEVLGYGPPDRHGCKAGGIGALFLEKMLAVLLREGPYLSSPLLL